MSLHLPLILLLAGAVSLVPVTLLSPTPAIAQDGDDGGDDGDEDFDDGYDDEDWAEYEDDLPPETACPDGQTTCQVYSGTNPGSRGVGGMTK